MEAEMADRDVCAVANRLNGVLCITGGSCSFQYSTDELFALFVCLRYGEEDKKCDKVR